MPTHLAVMDVSPDKRGSFENYTVRLAERLHAAGWRTVQAFWGPPPRWLESELRQAGAEIVVLSAQPEFADYVFGAAVHAQFSHLRLTVEVCHSPRRAGVAPHLDLHPQVESRHIVRAQ